LEIAFEEELVIARFFPRLLDALRAIHNPGEIAHMDADDRLEEIADVLGRINNKLDHVKPSLVWSVVALFVVFVLVPRWADSLFDSKTRYTIQYGVTTEHAFVQPEPHDCDFVRAPLGDKGCHYDKVVTTSKCGTDNATNKPIISYDDGKTWNWVTEGVTCQSEVAVSWNKDAD